MSSSEDSYDCWDYRRRENGGRIGPSLIKKRSRLIAAVVQNQVDVLRELLDSPKWYNVKDKQGYSLLQIAILLNNKEVFDYMLSIPDFPIEFRNKNNKTALRVALDYDIEQIVKEYFSYELLKRGARIDSTYSGDDLLLHCAIHQCYSKVAVELIKRGANVNVCADEGCSPLLCALCMPMNITETTKVVTTLLVEGAIPSTKAFEISVLRNYPLFVQEALFLHSVDQYSEINFRVLVELAKNKSPLFHEIVKSSCKVIFCDYHRTSFIEMCKMETDYLEIIIQKFRPCVAEFAEYSSRFVWVTERLVLKSLDLLLRSEFKFDVMYHFNVLGSQMLEDYEESHISEVFLCLLSHGLVLREEDLQFVYRKFGYCELFKLMLHMDFERDTEGGIKDIVAVFIYDVHMDLQKFLQSPKNFSLSSILRLFRYFHHPALIHLYYQLSNGKLVVKPHTPRLVELARNSFRKYVIDRYDIKTAGKFSTILKRLGIGTTYEKILTYQTKLY